MNMREEKVHGIRIVVNYTSRGAIGFTAGSFLIALSREVFGTASLIPFGVYILAGVIGALVLCNAESSTMRSVGFGIGLFLTGVLLAFTKYETIGADYGTAISGFAFAFALGGAIGGFAFGLKLMFAGAIAFGIAGAAGASLWVMWSTFGVGLNLFSLNYIRMALTIFPFILGGALFGMALGLNERKNAGEYTACKYGTWKLPTIAVVLVLLLISTMILPWISSREFYGKVIEVIDGDTIKVMRFLSPVRIRIAGVDCPEPGQPFFAEAREQTETMSLGKYVAVKGKERDKHGLLVADIIILGERKSLGIEILSHGLAWCEKNNTASTKLRAIEQGAKKNGKGLWSQSNPVPPWDFRHE
jgi:endonuclease YncB( thermonuclease family)